MNDVTTQIVGFVISLATPVLATLATALMVKALQRIGLQVDAERKARLEYVASQAILRAEEWAAARLKANLPATGTEKLQAAMVDLTDRIPGISNEEASALIHATLPKLGAGAAAFLQGARQAATTGAR